MAFFTTAAVLLLRGSPQWLCHANFSGQEAVGTGGRHSIAGGPPFSPDEGPVFGRIHLKPTLRKAAREGDVPEHQVKQLGYL